MTEPSQPDRVQGEVLVQGLQFPESPLWSARDGCLYFVEWIGDRVWYWKDGLAQVGFTLPTSSGPSGLCQSPSGDLWLCLYSARRVIKTTIRGELLQSFEGHMGQPFKGPNDMANDRLGGIYFSDAGNFEEDWVSGRPIGDLYYISPAGELSQMDDGLCYPNGVAVSPDGNTLYVNEHRQNRILAYRINPDGQLADRRVFYQLDQNCVLEEEACFELGPDGLSVDPQGNLWVAHYGGGKVVAIRPDGNLLGRLFIPRGRKPSSTAIHPAAGDLFVTEAEAGLLYRFPSARDLILQD